MFPSWCVINKPTPVRPWPPDDICLKWAKQMVVRQLMKEKNTIETTPGTHAWPLLLLCGGLVRCRALLTSRRHRLIVARRFVCRGARCRCRWCDRSFGGGSDVVVGSGRVSAVHPKAGPPAARCEHHRGRLFVVRPTSLIPLIATMPSHSRVPQKRACRLDIRLSFTMKWASTLKRRRTGRSIRIHAEGKT